MRKVVLNLMLLCAAMVAHSQLMAVPPQFTTTVSEVSEVNVCGDIKVQAPILSEQMVWRNFILEHKATAAPIIQPISLFESSPMASKLYEGSAAKYKMNGTVAVTGNLSFASSAVLDMSGMANEGSGDDRFGPPGDEDDEEISTDNFLPVGNIPWGLMLMALAFVAVRIRKRAKA